MISMAEFQKPVTEALRRLASTASSAAKAIDEAAIKAKDDETGPLTPSQIFDVIHPHAKNLFGFGMVYSALKRAAAGKPQKRKHR